MNAIRSFLRLRAEKRGTLVKSLAVLWLVRLGLWLLPFRVTRSILARVSSARNESLREDTAIARQVTWAVTKAADFVPASTCLARAMATHLLLTRRGQMAELRIGVAKNKKGHLEAHAWVESYEKVVIGQLPEQSHYSRMPPLPM